MRSFVVRLCAVVATAGALPVALAAQPPGQKSAPPGQLLIQAAAVSADETVLMVSGQGFGPAPVVTVAGIPLGGVTVSGDGTHLTALMPAVPPGNYRLVVSRGPGAPHFDVFEMTVGATGPEGAPGAEGPPGILGLAGLSCPAGQALVGFDGDSGLVCQPFQAGSACPAGTVEAAGYCW